LADATKCAALVKTREKCDFVVAKCGGGEPKKTALSTDFSRRYQPRGGYPVWEDPRGGRGGNFHPSRGQKMQYSSGKSAIHFIQRSINVRHFPRKTTFGRSAESKIVRRVIGDAAGVPLRIGWRLCLRACIPMPVAPGFFLGVEVPSSAHRDTQPVIHRRSIVPRACHFPRARPPGS
jgi:hypothetical protein